MKTYMENKISEQEGYFGIYGGQFIGDELKAEFDSIYEQFLKLKSDESFQKELADLLEHFSCRPTPVYFAKNLSKKAGCEIYLKREDLNHTGAHKINHSLGEALLAKRIGKTAKQGNYHLLSHHDEDIEHNAQEQLCPGCKLPQRDAAEQNHVRRK